jgi:glycosyltransferase involved in cell wall biosynthesis
MEILVIDGMSTDNTRDIITSISKQYPIVKLIDNPAKIVPTAMNKGIKSAKGDYIIRLDAHSEYPPGYFTKLIEWSKKLDADNVGAVWETDVLKKNRKSIAIVKVLTNKYGVGNGLFRIGVCEPKIVDTVPFGCYKKRVFDKIGLYNEKLVRNQDIELNKRIAKNNGKIYLVPEITCTYYAREKYSSIAKNNYRNGLWNILTVYITKKFDSLSPRHFIPLGFLFSLIAPIFLALIDPAFLWIAATSFFFYNVLVFSQAIKLNNKKTTVLNIVWAFYTLHFSYGLGSLVGLFHFKKLF